MLNSRCIHVLIEVLNAKTYIKLQTLSDIFHVSMRTIRYDLEDIDYFLKNNDLKPIVRKPNYGLFFQGNEKDKEDIIFFLRETMKDSKVFSKEERRLEILYTVAFTRVSYKIEDVCKSLDASISAVMKDMDKLKTMFAAYGVVYRSKTLKGDEITVRKAIMGVYTNLLGKAYSQEIVQYVSDDSVILGNVYVKIFEGINKDLLRGSLLIFCTHVIKFPTNEQVLRYIVNIAVQIRRMSIGAFAPQGNEMFIFDDGVSKAANEIARLWSQHGVHLDENELLYFMQSIERTEDDLSNFKEYINMADIQMLCHTTCTRVFKDINMPYGDFDYDLINGLAEEIPRIIFKASIFASNKNIFLKHTFEYSHELFDAVKHAMTPVEILVKRKLTDDEISCLTIYFIDYIERKKLLYTRPKVTVTSPEKNAFNELMMKRLELIFDIDITELILTRDIPKHHEFSGDFVISVYTAVEANIPCLSVSPILTQQDVQYLKNYLPMKISQPIPESKQGQPSLGAIMAKDFITINFGESMLDKVVNKSFEMLYSGECVSLDFLNDLYTTMNDIGVYTVIGNGVLFLHSRNFSYTKTHGLCLVRPVKELEVHNGDRYEKFALIFTLAATDKNSHMRILGELAQIINDEAKMKTLKNSMDINEILKQFSS